MDLTNTEVRDLAGFFARRFPSYRNRNSLCLAARLPAREHGEAPALDAWADLIEYARRRRVLGRLARVAARADDADENLQRVCTELSSAEPPGVAPMAMAAVGAMAVVGLGAWWAVRGQIDGPTDVFLEQAPVASASPARAFDLVSAVPPGGGAPRRFADNPLDAARQKTVASVEPPQGVMSAPEVAPASVVVPAPEPEEERAPLANFSGRCTTEEGGLIGYWYAGDLLPGDAGETITMTSGVYVRADYPDEHNDFDSHSAVRCALRAGDRVRLSMPPMRVPGDRYWVPLVHGDLVPE